MDEQQQFYFDNCPGSISVFSQQLLKKLAAQLESYYDNGQLLFRVKYIIGELLNNAVKHSGSQQTVFTLQIVNNTIIITKTDNGQPLSLLQKAQNLLMETPVLISADGIHELYAINYEKEKLKFVCYEPNAGEVVVNDLHEHLGLLIITKASNQFTYCYQQPLNIFTVKVNLEK